jgi:hypothetical protein
MTPRGWWCAVAILSAAPAVADPAGPTDPSTAKITAALGALGAAARCEARGTRRAWCTAAAYPTGTATTLPPQALLGLSIDLRFGADAGRALRHVTLVALAVDGHGLVRLAPLPSMDADEEVEARRAITNLTAVLEHRVDVAEVHPDLGGSVRELAGTAAPRLVGGAWRWQGLMPTTMRQVGDAWVVLEHARDGVVVSVLTDRY